MSSIYKKIFILLTLSFVLFTVVNAAESSIFEVDSNLENYEFIEEQKLNSSRYTKVDDLTLVDPSLFIDIEARDDLVESNDHFNLYYNDSDISFKVENKNTGYVWSSVIDNPNAGTYDGLLTSSIGLEYIQVQKDMAITENVGLSDTIYEAETVFIDNGVKVSITFGGYCATRNCERLYPAYLDGVYTLEDMIEIGFTELNLSMDLVVTLEETGVKASVPFDSIVEPDTENIVLSSIMIFPGLGATYMDEIPGYMVIPDGAGALIRYEDNEGQFVSPFDEWYFGGNHGFDDLTLSVTNYPLSMPIFGAVHGVNQNGFLGIVEEGCLNAKLLAYPNGSHNLDYNLIYTKFALKEVYRQSFSSDGSGGARKYLQTSTSDMTIDYNFLTDLDANYVGIAKAYRDYLDLDNQTTSEDIPIYLQYLMSDSENSFFGSSLVEMSSVDQVRDMYNFFLEQGLLNQSVGLMGWNDGGYSGHLPSDLDFENKLGSNRSYRGLIDYINDTNSVMLLNSYLFASNGTRGISYNNDVASGSNRFKLELERDGFVYSDLYLLYPEAARDMAIDGYQDYIDEGVQVLLPGVASNLYSYYDSGQYNRSDSYNYFMEILQLYDNIGNYFYPYSYAYEYTNAFYDAPLYNSQLKYYDDVVPLLQIVLVGSMDLYSSPLNFNSLGQETILNLIDFGISPSYVVSKEEASELKNTDLRRFYTTEFDLWKHTITEEYSYINNALKHVSGSTIEGRIVLELGIVKVSYSNGVDIYINYTTSDFSRGAISVSAMDYFVGGIS